MTTYERIQNAAKKRGMNLRQVAKAAGMKSETAIYRYNQGVTPRESTLRAIADVLGVSVDYLLGNTDEMHPAQSNIVSINNKNIELKDLLDPEQIEQRTVSYDGQPISDHDMKLIQTILEQMAKGEN